ncbi:2-dehydro-3-deoxygalactonokinase [Halalkalibaculum sp. DA384]|uniref:2-dehydro-3-deoxygalactonokinase n=1 Tax=Halalkalibaculum sp. DA384 TaxID=3373606 RepID=UPI003754869A
MRQIHNANNYFFSCDWGTTSFRLSLVDSNTRNVIYQHDTSGGVKNLFGRWSRDPGHPDRETFFLKYLEDQIRQVADQVSPTLKNIPVLISGMASSSIGIVELPYARVPFSLADASVSSRLIPRSDHNSRDILLISGVRSSSDVMRGEEVQLLGLAAGFSLEDAVAVMPGTHSKHVFIRQQQVTDFKTYMTGEVFELLSSRSVLSDSVSSGDILHTDAFLEGVKKGCEENLLHALFEVRIRDLLAGVEPAPNFDFLSGLIIGSEVGDLLSISPGDLYIIGSDPLNTRYKTALEYLDFNPETVPNPGDLIIQGHLKIINRNT